MIRVVILYNVVLLGVERVMKIQGYPQRTRLLGRPKTLKYDNSKVKL